MNTLILQTLLLLGLAYLLGALLGCVIRKLFSGEALMPYEETNLATAGATVGAATAGAVAVDEIIRDNSSDTEIRITEPEPAAPEPVEPRPIEPRPDFEADLRRSERLSTTTTETTTTTTTTEQKPDDLTIIKGIGTIISGKLNEMGVTRYDHIAKWQSDDIEYVNSHLSFKGRVEREDWIGQAKALAAGTAYMQPQKTKKQVDLKDDLKLIKGIGPVVEERLNQMGYNRFENIIAWTPTDIKRISEALEFKGRIERERWVAQAVKLKEERDRARGIMS